MNQHDVNWVKLADDHDSDPTTLYAAVIFVSFLIVAVFFLNIMYKRRKKPPKKRIRVIGKTPKSNSYLTKSGV